MQARLGQCIRIIPSLALAALIALLAPVAALAAPYAALLMDARTGQIIYQDNADTRLHPASLTKMLTLYITFDAIRRGEISLDAPVKVTAHAASQPPSRLGLRAGQVIPLRYLIRAAAVKSANDAAAAIGDYISGDEAHFAARMNATAKALGMTESTFKNANGLTRPGHLSSAHDMAILARHLIYDFPEYYNIFSRTETDAGIATVYSTNRKFLEAYDGADGIKTGYTVPSGFNLVASAVRGNKRLIGVIFGGTSTADRNAKMEKLLDMGFTRVADNVPLRKPVPPDLSGIARGQAAPAPVAVAQADTPDDSGNPNGVATTGKTVRVNTVLASSERPQPRPEGLDAPAAAAADPGAADPGTQVADAGPGTGAVADPETSPLPAPRPTYASVADAVADNDGEAVDPNEVAIAAGSPPDAASTAGSTAGGGQQVAAAAPMPKPRPEIVFASVAPAAAASEKPDPAPEVISRLSTSGGHDWAITLGRYNSRDQAEKALLKIALAEPTVLDQALRKVVDRKAGFDATFVGLTHRQADLACARIQARAQACFALAP